MTLSLPFILFLSEQSHASDMSKLVGTGWALEQSEIECITTFHPDGTVLVDYKEASDFTGTWTQLDKNKYQIKIQYFEMTGRIEGEKLILKNGDQEKIYIPKKVPDKNEIPVGNSSFLNKSFTLESNEHFKLYGDPQTQIKLDGEKSSQKTIQLNTKMVGVYPSKFTNKGTIAGSGYLYMCKLELLNPDWNPNTSRRILGNIRAQIAEQTNINFSSTFDSGMNSAGKGMINLYQAEKTTLTLILIATDDPKIFHLCGTYTETK